MRTPKGEVPFDFCPSFGVSDICERNLPLVSTRFSLLLARPFDERCARLRNSIRQPLQGGGVEFSSDAALPDHNDFPPVFHERIADLEVASNIVGKFCPPFFGVGRGCRGLVAAGMAVPEAAMDENRRAPFRQDDVGVARQCALVETKAEPMRVKKFAHGDLGPRIGRPDSRHHSGSGCGVDDVHDSWYPGMLTKWLSRCRFPG